MSIRTRLQNAMPRLTAADHRLLRILLADPQAAAGLSITELARRASVHEASAVRLAKRLGYSGYPDLRADLQSDVQATRAPSARLQHTVAHTDPRALLDELIHAERRALTQIADNVSQADLTIAADTLIGAKRIAIFAQGHADALATLAMRRLTRTGYNVVDLCCRERDLSERLVSLTGDDAILAFTLRRLPADIRPLTRVAAEVSARMILISDQLGWALQPRPHVILSSPRGDEAGYQTLTVPMAILNALLLNIAARDDGRSIAGLERSASLARLFEE